MKRKEMRDYLNASYQSEDVPQGTSYWTRKLLQIAISRMEKLIRIEGLPSSLPRSDIELSLFITGNAVIVNKFGTYWCPLSFKPYGGLSSNVYNTSIQFVGSNPMLGSMKGWDMKDGVIVYNTDIDAHTDGLQSLAWETIQRYANILAHVESTSVNMAINKRVGMGGTAVSSQLAEAISEIQDSIKLGHTKTVQANTSVVDNLRTISFDGDKQQMLSDVTQARDYFLNCFLNDIGLQTLEEKKERMITREVDADAEMLSTEIFTYAKHRILMCEKINLLYGLSLSCHVEGV